MLLVPLVALFSGAGYHRNDCRLSVGIKRRAFGPELVLPTDKYQSLRCSPASLNSATIDTRSISTYDFEPQTILCQLLSNHEGTPVIRNPLREEPVIWWSSGTLMKPLLNFINSKSVRSYIQYLEGALSLANQKKATISEYVHRVLSLFRYHHHHFALLSKS